MAYKYNYGGVKLHEELYDQFIEDKNYRVLDDGTIWNVSTFISSPNYTVKDDDTIWLSGAEDETFHKQFFPAINFSSRYLATCGFRSPRRRLPVLYDAVYTDIDVAVDIGASDWYYIDGDTVYCSSSDTFKQFQQWTYFCPDELYTGMTFPGNFKRIWRLDKTTLSYNLTEAFDADPFVTKDVWKLTGSVQYVDTYEDEYPPEPHDWPRDDPPSYPNPLEFPLFPDARLKYLIVPYEGWFLKAHRIVYRKFHGPFNSIFNDATYAHNIIPDPPPYIPYPILHLNGDVWDNRPQNLVECFYHPELRRKLWSYGYFFWPDKDDFVEFDNQGTLICSNANSSSSNNSSGESMFDDDVYASGASFNYEAYLASNAGATFDDVVTYLEVRDISINDTTSGLHSTLSDFNDCASFRYSRDAENSSNANINDDPDDPTTDDPDDPTTEDPTTEDPIVSDCDNLYEDTPDMTFFKLTDELIAWIETTSKDTHPTLYQGDYNYTLDITVTHDKRDNMEYPESLNYNISYHAIQWNCLGQVWVDLGTYNVLPTSTLKLIDAFFDFLEEHPEYQSAYDEYFG